MVTSGRKLRNMLLLLNFESRSCSWSMDQLDQAIEM
ncbi:Bulb-type lectin domain-containing protein [Psidium guajava]|nr:Bulb-type lectin domain-containing protein [Psidium guajava]